jgi:hypothetical protein
VRVCTCWLLALTIFAATGGQASAQAGRYVPLPRAPGGGGGRFLLHIPWHGDISQVWPIILVLAGAIVLAVLGWMLGLAFGRWLRGTRPHADPGVVLRGAVPRATPAQDLILSPDDVIDKSLRTTGLLQTLANQDSLFDPTWLREFIHTTFCRVQECWQARDYDPVRHLLMPGILARHEELIRLMRREHEINRMQNLKLRRFEFVHVHSRETIVGSEVTALITFEARVSFVNDRTGRYVRGLQEGLFQEFWTFGRQADGWRLQDIERSTESDRLRQENVADILSLA